MASSTPPITNLRGNGNTNPNGAASNATPSRLLTSTNGIRNDLESRNLYTPNRLYPITNKTQVQNVINAVGGIASMIAPFKAYNLENTVYGRLLGIPTPLTTISLAMLGRQFAFNSGSYIAKNNFPVIKVANLFDGNKNTHLFTPAVNFQITKKARVSNFQQFLNAVVYYYPAKDNPFTPTSTNADYIKNSGPGQLTFLYSAMNRNIYKEGFSTSYNDVVLTQSSTAVKLPITKRNTIIGSDSSPLNKYANYFNFFNANPYSELKLTNIASTSITNANGAMVFAMENPQSGPNTDTTQEYAPSADFVRLNFGVTNKTDKQENGFQISQVANNWVNQADEFGDDGLSNKLIWGRDGITNSADGNINALRGTMNHADEQVDPTGNRNTGFNAYSGLLEYTRNLLNASEGAVVDMTRKAFIKGRNVIGFNGSNLWVANDSTYAIASGIDGKTGVRQHSALDQYDRFAKAIRFNGNSVYGGNPNSVIYDRVMPRIHPTLPVDKITGVPNNHNLMFSIENLAVRVISKSGVGIIDDEYGSQIPICEVGQFNGRMMWFPPYNIEINESTSAKYESTVMVGRSEPMYSYQYSERSATLSFTLLVDYPQNLKNQQYQNDNQHRAIAEFFAFGGEPYSPSPIITNSNQKIVRSQQHIQTITGPTQTAEPEVVIPPETKMVFPNDNPEPGQETSIINTMYKSFQYQIADGSFSPKGYKSNGLNKEVYVVTGMTGQPNIDLHFDSSLVPPNFSQYTDASLTCPLNQRLNDLYKTVSNRTMFEINIVGAASKLNDHTVGYNKALGLRRANAVKHLVQQRLAALFPNQDLTAIAINVSSVGADQADPANGTAAAIERPATIQERYATINFARTRQAPPPKAPLLSYNSGLVVGQLNDDIQGLSKVTVKQNSSNVSQCVYNERKGDVVNDSGDGAILRGFKSVEGNYFYPVFHSQTPEDFHRRLTFLTAMYETGCC